MPGGVAHGYKTGPGVATLLYAMDPVTPRAPSSPTSAGSPELLPERGSAILTADASRAQRSRSTIGSSWVTSPHVSLMICLVSKSSGRADLSKTAPKRARFSARV